MASRLSQAASLLLGRSLTSFSAGRARSRRGAPRWRASSSAAPTSAMRSRSPGASRPEPRPRSPEPTTLSRSSRISRCSSTHPRRDRVARAAARRGRRRERPCRRARRAFDRRRAARKRERGARVFDDHRIAHDGRDERLVLGAKRKTVEQRADHAVAPRAARARVARHAVAASAERSTRGPSSRAPAPAAARRPRSASVHDHALQQVSEQRRDGDRELGRRLDAIDDQTEERRIPLGRPGSSRPSPTPSRRARISSSACRAPRLLASALRSASRARSLSSDAWRSAASSSARARRARSAALLRSAPKPATLSVQPGSVRSQLGELRRGARRARRRAWTRGLSSPRFAARARESLAFGRCHL